eukprot:1193063-Prorocentrum_minimum.AAC.3
MATRNNKFADAVVSEIWRRSKSLMNLQASNKYMDIDTARGVLIEQVASQVRPGEGFRRGSKGDPEGVRRRSEGVKVQRASSSSRWPARSGGGPERIRKGPEGFRSGEGPEGVWRGSGGGLEGDRGARFDRGGSSKRRPLRRRRLGDAE